MVRARWCNLQSLVFSLEIVEFKVRSDEMRVSSWATLPGIKGNPHLKTSTAPDRHHSYQPLRGACSQARRESLPSVYLYTWDSSVARGRGALHPLWTKTCNMAQPAEDDLTGAAGPG
jgi:hypothetical protein